MLVDIPSAQDSLSRESSIQIKLSLVTKVQKPCSGICPPAIRWGGSGWLSYQDVIVHLCLRKEAVPFAGRVGAVVPRAGRSHVIDREPSFGGGEEKDTPSVFAALQEEGS